MSDVSFLNRLAVWDNEAWDEVARMVTSDPKAVAPIVWELLTKTGQRDDAGMCGELLALWVRSSGPDVVGDTLLRNWANLPDYARVHFDYGSHNPEAMSNELAFRLFESPDSSVEDRHLLAAGLTVTARERGLEFTLDGLFNKIGTYADPDRQQTLEAFLLSARGHLESLRGPKAG